MAGAEIPAFYALVGPPRQNIILLCPNLLVIKSGFPGPQTTRAGADLHKQITLTP